MSPSTISAAGDNAEALLSDLAAAGIRLEPLSGGQLKATPKVALTDDLRQRIRTHLAVILEMLLPGGREAASDVDEAAAVALSPCGAVSVSVSAAGVFVELASERILHADHLADLPQVERAAVLDLVRSGALWETAEVVWPLRRRWAGQLRERAGFLDLAAAAGFMRAAEVLEPLVDLYLTT